MKHQMVEEEITVEMQYLEGFVHPYSINGLHKAITNHEHVKIYVTNDHPFETTFGPFQMDHIKFLVNKLKEPSGVLDFVHHLE